MKKILFDINHPCDVNLFKHVIRQLSADKDVDVSITYLLRNPVPVIVQKELPAVRKKAVGRHRGNPVSIILEANIMKFFRIFAHILKNRPDLCLSFGSFVMGAACKLLRIKNIQFYDDPENKKNKALQEITADSLYYPIFYNEPGKIKKFNALKEWAYLSPGYFTPDPSKLKNYGLWPKKYIFIREVSTKTTNYLGQQSNALYKIKDFIPEGCRVILSLEDKTKRSLYPAEWIMLKEPVEDIYSLIYYSALLISSGDSMAREGALLGVPSIYAGERIMQANKYLEEMGLLCRVNSEELNSYLRDFFDHKIAYPDQEKVRKDLCLKFEDLNNFILDLIYCR